MWDFVPGVEASQNFTHVPNKFLQFMILLFIQDKNLCDGF